MLYSSVRRKKFRFRSDFDSDRRPFGEWMRTGDFTRTVAGEVAMFRRLQDFAAGNHSPSASTKGDPLSLMKHEPSDHVWPAAAERFF